LSRWLTEFPLRSEMASKKKAKKSRRPAKIRAAKAKKSVKKSAKKAVSKGAGKKALAKNPVKAKKKQIVGEGNYAASRAFLKDQAGFVKKNRARIPAMGKAAEKALEGPEGDALRQAEAAGLARSRETF
jgi:hypothetical protein